MDQASSSDTESSDTKRADPENIIGILSGMGPYAGLDLAAKIHRFTEAHADQEHLSVALLSYPGRIVDRSTYLFDPAQPNPAPALAEIARRLEEAGAVVAGMPCNTAHGPAIFEALKAELRRTGHQLRFVHMIEATAAHIRHAHPGLQRVGVLSSLAVYELHLYKDVLDAAGFTTVRPSDEMQRAVVNPVIFNAAYGIKAQSAPVTRQARADLLKAAAALRADGAEAIILGCTEFPLALPEAAWGGLPLIDPTAVLARALIQAVAPDKLKPLPQAAAAAGCA